MTQQRKVALVTGASRGIGAAIAQQLILDGYFVVGTATSEAGAEKLSASFAENGAGKVLDVRDATAIDALVTDIEQKYGPVLALVNNAGITKDNLLLRMSEDDWDDILNIHLKAVYRLSKRVLKGMTKARFGRIINISSVVAHFANPGQANYSAAKAGIEAFGRSLAKEMRAGGAALERGRGKRQGVAAQGNAHQAQRTFLDHHAVLLRAVARLQSGVAGAQRGVARKRQLAIGAEDAQAVVGPGRAPGVGGRHQKGGFRQVGPGRKAAHVAVAQAVGIQHHGHGVAVAGAVAEHVDLLEGALVHGEAHARG